MSDRLDATTEQQQAWRIAELERELAEARAETKRLSDFMTGRVIASPDREYYDRAEQAESALAALQEQRCETCKYMRDDDHVGEPCCTISLTWIPCRVLGNRCGAWQSCNS